MVLSRPLFIYFHLFSFERSRDSNSRPYNSRMWGEDSTITPIQSRPTNYVRLTSCFNVLKMTTIKSFVNFNVRRSAVRTVILLMLTVPRWSNDLTERVKTIITDLRFVICSPYGVFSDLEALGLISFEPSLYFLFQFYLLFLFKPFPVEV